MSIRGIDQLDVAGKTVLVRSDLNVPLDGSTITDDGRIVASVPTIKALLAGGAKVVVLAHLGRPKGEPDAKYSLAPAAARLGELLGQPVALAPVTSGPEAAAVVAGISAGQVAMLENVRFDARETSKVEAERAELAAEWAALGDLYVSDGFGVVHRAQASVTELAKALPHAAGLLVEAETKVFRKLLDNPDRPYVVILGGSKVSDKLGVVQNLLKSVDRLLVGGGMAYTFLAAAGHSVGNSLLEKDQIETVKELVAGATAAGIEIVVPVDLVIADDFAPDANTQIVDADSIPDGWEGLDIGPKTRELFASKIADAKTVVWNGPVGVFEMDAFSAGTRAVAEAMTKIDATTVIGGGDSAAAVRILGIDEAGFTHISTGGGASLEFLEGKTLPGIAVLEDN
jgi:phosphoglycerate kinase